MTRKNREEKSKLKRVRKLNRTITIVEVLTNIVTTTDIIKR